MVICWDRYAGAARKLWRWQGDARVLYDGDLMGAPLAELFRCWDRSGMYMRLLETTRAGNMDMR
jgi:hypothetical protein